MNYFSIIILALIIYCIALVVKRLRNVFNDHSIEINEINLGIGSNSSIKLVYNTKEKDIAYKLWVEMSTRKIGLEFEEDDDVITEVYNSWYEFFRIARELMKEIPVNNSDDVLRLTELTEKVLNKGLRPHLTKWQARYRKWYDEAIKTNEGRDPQEIQKDYDKYSELVADMLSTNKKMIEYKNVLWEIAKGKQK